jgi:hypothetical protein
MSNLNSFLPVIEKPLHLLKHPGKPTSGHFSSQFLDAHRVNSRGKPIFNFAERFWISFMEQQNELTRRIDESNLES